MWIKNPEIPLPVEPILPLYRKHDKQWRIYIQYTLSVNDCFQKTPGLTAKGASADGGGERGRDEVN